MIRFPDARPAMLLSVAFTGLGFLVGFTYPHLVGAMIAGLLVLVIHYLIAIVSALHQLYHRLDGRLFDVISYLNQVTNGRRLPRGDEKPPGNSFDYRKN